MQSQSLLNPTAKIDLNFGRYLSERDQKLSAHLLKQVPDYAFSMDMKLRQQLSAIRLVRVVAKSLVSMIVPIQKQIQTMRGVIIGPTQYPEIYTLGEDCAKTLGIGIPQIFIYYSPQMDGYTIATDDVMPMIVLSSALVDAFEPAELKFVIGHECGHIHNLHGVYNTFVELMTNALAGVFWHTFPGLSSLRVLFQTGLSLFFLRWSRCAEITADRAGLICCGDTETAYAALAKLAIGGVERLRGINIKEYIKQIRMVQSTPVRLIELMQTHPLIPKRIEALRFFSQCDVLHRWRPELCTSEKSQDKQEVDFKCEQFIKVISNKYVDDAP